MFKTQIVSTHNPVIKHLVKLRTNARYRIEQGHVVISGLKLVAELSEVLPPSRLFSLEPLPIPHIRVSESVMKKITGLPSPEGMAAEFPFPEATSLKNKAPLLVLDRITDPGNMGTLLRTALALGWKGVFFLPGCVDPFHEKVIRASRGALFYLPWQEGDWEQLRELPHTAYTADIEGRPLPEVAPNENSMLVLSNEAQGISPEGAELGERVTIPMPGKMESLNVAISGAIMMYALTSLRGDRE
ncbi:MAG: 23S rRNA (guanosine-2'-O-)-methyltransferase RlmB [Chlamydiales bacterium]|nr:23S rRNA (guanosine-2'-O-)-methyltransferase RlmB [Chlamydiales bacterium]